MNARAALSQATEILAGGGVAEPRLTAEVLLLHALGRERVFLFSHPEYELTALEWLHLGRYLHQRLKGAPTQHVTRRQEFFGRDFRVSPAVLIPRPETEHLIEHALLLAPGAERILDIGTGSGILAVTLSLELRAWAVATDLSAAALEVARANAGRLAARVDFLQCDLATAVQGPFDLIVSNPPYIPAAEMAGLQPEVRDHEPHLALQGPGEDGTGLYPRIIEQAERLLTPGGWLLFEIGYQGGPAVSAAFGPRWRNVRVARDLAGLPRVVCGQYLPE